MARALAHAQEPELALGRYRPLRPLGSGGSGSVWLARDEQTGLDVALKIVPLAGKAGSRAEREAEASARLRHPGCLRAYGYGSERGHFYIAYEYSPGKTFRDALRSRELSDGDVVEACAQIAEAVAHAHGQGILHRDVKPANVLLVDGPGVSVRLLDFGLAAFEDAQTLTAQGDVPGTLAYISPERLAGGPSSPAADVWALGVMLWEALAHRHPFVRQSLRETGDAIEAGAPPLATLRPDLPKHLLAAVDRALSLDPRRRPSAAKLAFALRHAGALRRSERAGGEPLVAPSRLAYGAAAGLVAGVGGALLPFWPAPLQVVLAALAAALAFVRPKLGLGVAFGALVFPVGNISLGLALAYAIVALAVVALSSQRAVAAGVATLGAYLAVRPPNASVSRLEHPLEAGRELVLALPAEAWRLGVVSALAAAALPLATTHWRIAIWGAATLAAGALPNVGVDAWPLVATVWAACAALALKPAT